MFDADTLVTRYVLDDSGYTKGATRVVSATQATSKAMDNAGKKAKAFQSDINKGFTQFYDKLKFGLDIASKFMGVMVGIGGAIIGASLIAARKAADFDALTKSLEAVEGSGKRAKQEMAALFDLAKGPGLAPLEAIQGFVGLRQAGISEDFAREIIAQAGNANAIAGGGRAELDQVLRAFKQIATKPFLQGDELLQLMEGGIPATKMVADIFGTADTEALKKAGVDSTMILEGLVLAMQKMPRAASSAKNELENFETSMEMAMTGFGTGVLASVIGTVSEATKVLEDFGQAGIFKNLGEIIGNDIMSVLGVLDTGNLRGNMIELGAGLVTVSAATRNFFMQLGDVVEFLINLLPPLARWGIEKLGDREGMLNPQAEGDRFRKESYARMRQFDQGKDARAKEAAQKSAEAAARLGESQADFDKRLAEAKAKLGDPNKKQVDHLKNIEANTRKLVEMQNMILGGGAVTSAAFNAVNLNRSTGGGSDIKQAAMEFADKIESAWAKKLEGLARHQHLNPRAV